MSGELLPIAYNVKTSFGAIKFENTFTFWPTVNQTERFTKHKIHHQNIQMMMDLFQKSDTRTHKTESVHLPSKILRTAKPKTPKNPEIQIKQAIESIINL